MRGLGPGHFQAGGDGVAGLAGAEAGGPAQALGLQTCGFGFGADMGCRAGAMGLAKGMAAGYQSHGFLIVHGHAGEGVAYVVSGRDRVAVAVRTFGVDVDQAHLHGGQRVFGRAHRCSGYWGFPWGQPFFSAPQYTS